MSASPATPDAGIRPLTVLEEIATGEQYHVERLLLGTIEGTPIITWAEAVRLSDGQASIIGLGAGWRVIAPMGVRS